MWRNIYRASFLQASKEIFNNQYVNVQCSRKRERFNWLLGIAVSNEDAMETARRLAREEGIFGGTTSGANVWAAMQRAEMLGAGKKIVTVVVDSGLKYLQGELYKQ